MVWEPKKDIDVREPKKDVGGREKEKFKARAGKICYPPDRAVGKIFVRINYTSDSKDRIEIP